MVFHFTEVFAPGSTYLESPDATQLKGFIELCLSDEIWQTDYVNERLVIIFESFHEDLNNLNPLQEYLLHFENTTDFTDFFGVSLEELTQMATSDDQTCLRGDFAVDWLVP
jgi:hypothetical protein